MGAGGATSRSREKFEDYDGFVKKFEPKKTTDDCYTPPEVYEAVAGWVSERYGIDRADMVRPFWPGGDYEALDYPAGCCLVDNPPFSILQRIKEFYLERGVPFFLFAPTLTLFVVGADRATAPAWHRIASREISQEEGSRKAVAAFGRDVESDLAEAIGG